MDDYNYDEAIRQRDSAKSTRTAFQNMRGAQSIAPDKVPEIEKIASDTGLSFMFAAENHGDLSQPNIREFEKQAQRMPRTITFMEKLENAAIVKDDFDALAEVETKYDDWRTYTAPFQSLAAGTIGEGGFGSMLSGAANVYDLYAKGVNTAFDYVAPQAVADFKNKPLVSAEFDSAVSNYIAPDKVFGNAGAFLKGGGDGWKPDEEYENFLTDVTAGVGSMASQIAISPLGAPVQLSALFSMGVDSMDALIEDDNASPTERAAALLMGGGVTMATEKLQLDYFLKYLPKETKSTVLNYIGSVIKSAGAEGAQEMLESLMHDLSRRATTNGAAPVGEGIVREGAVGASVGALAQAAMLYATRRSHYRGDPVKTREGIKALQEAVQKTKLHQRSPQKMREYLVKQDSSDIYIDGEQALTLYQSLPDSQRDEINKLIPDLPRKISDAAASGNEVMIKSADYFAYVAPFADMSEHIKLHPENITAGAMPDFEQQVEDAKLILKTELSEADILERRLATEMVRTGRERESDAAVKAKIIRSTYETMLERGMSAEQGQAVINQAMAGLSFQNQTGDSSEFDVFRALDLNQPDSLIGALGYRPDSLSEFARKIFDAKPEEITADIRQSFRDARKGVPSSRKAITLIGFLRSQRSGKYGIRGDASGEVSELIKRNPQFRSVKNNKKGYTLDELGEAAFQEGYFLERPTEAEVIEALSNEMSGDGVTIAPSGAEALQYENYIADLADQISAKGINIQTATDEEIQAALADVANNEADAIRIAADKGFVSPETTPDQFREALVKDAAGNRVYDSETMADIEAYNSGTQTMFQPAPKIDSQAFKDWFGDSKVVDDNGEPLVVYHGTNDSFDAFSMDGKAGNRPKAGAYFTNEPDVAATYSGFLGANVIATYLTIKKPLIVYADGANWSSIKPTARFEASAREDTQDFDILQQLGIVADSDVITKKEESSGVLSDLFTAEKTVFGDDFISTDFITRYAKNNGFDGVIFKDLVDRGSALKYSTEKSSAPSDVYVAFEPTQIKSVNNKGAFNPNDARILYQDAPAVESSAFKKWFAKGKVVDGEGEPLVVYHSTLRNFEAFDANAVKEKSRDNVFSGFHFGTAEQAEARFNIYGAGGIMRQAGFGRTPQTIPVYLNIQNPLRVEDALTDEGWSVVIEDAIAEGYDGLVYENDYEGGGDSYVAFEPNQIKSVNNRGTFDPKDGRILYQEETPDDLYVAHNLSADNVLHVDKMGGLPVPSIAIARNNVDTFSGFGDITLIADKSMIDPKASSENKVFAADIYSPRYPSVSLNVNLKDWNKLIGGFADVREFGFVEPDISNFESDGLRYLENNDAVRYEYLKREGKAPKIVYVKPKYPAYLRKYLPEKGGYFDWQTMHENEKFVADVKKHIDEQIAARDDQRGKDMVRSAYYEDDGSISFRMIRDIAHRLGDEPRGKEKKPDGRAMRDAVRNKMNSPSIQQGFNQWVRDTFEPLVDSEQIFNGFTPSGTRKYLSHNLDNVVMLLKKQLRAGESFNYGVGTIRSAFTKQFKSIADIQNSRDKIISDADFDIVKKEVDDEFFALSTELDPYYKFSRSSASELSEIMVEASTKGLSRAMGSAYENVPAELMEKVAGFLNKLRDMPTEYFEAKLQRAVGLSEFAGAVVPKGTNKAAIDVLKKNGLKVKMYDPKEAGSRQKAVGSFSKLFFQDKRGQIQFTPNGQSIITLFGKSDASTALHELGHFYLNRILKPLSELPDAPQQIKDDMQLVYDFLGVEGGDITIEQDEKFARAFEAYLREGKAPSKDLQGVFRTLKKWMLQIYASVKKLDVEITDDIRGVFDRMLATDAEIQELADLNHYKADPAISQTLDKATLARYERMASEAIEKARETLLKRALRQKARESAEWYKTERDRIEGDVEESLATSSLYQLLDYLQKGIDGAGNKVQAVKISRKSVVDLMGEQFAGSMPSGTMVKNGGVDAALIAETYGFPSANSMLKALANAETKKQRIKRLTDERMIQEFGDMLADGTLSEEALNEVHSAERMKVIEQEMKIVAELAKVPATTAAEANAVANAIMMQKTVDEAIKPHGYYQAEIRAARAFGKAMGSKNFAEAALQKRKQMLNHALYREARAARQLIEKSQVRFKKLNQSDKKLAKYRNLDLVNLARAAVSRFGLGDFQIDANQLLIEMQEADPESVRDFDAALYGDVMMSSVKNWRDMTMSDYRMLTDSVDNLYHSARELKMVQMGEDRRNLDEVVQEIIANIDKNFTGKLRDDSQDEGFLDDLKSNFHDYVASLKKISFIARRIDGEEGGAMHKAIIRPLNEAESDRAERMRSVIKDINKLFTDNYSAGERFKFRGLGSDRIIVDEYNIDISKEEAIALALNWGNEVNRQRVLATPRFNSTEKVQAVLDKLDKRDMDFVQGVWDYINSFWPDIVALDKKTLGYAPEKQAAAPVTTPHGIYRGGYFPIKYNPKLSAPAQAIAEVERLDKIVMGRGSSPQTKRGHTKSRQANVKDLYLDFSLDTIGSHIDNVLFDLTHREAVNQVVKVLRNNDLQQKIYQTYGSETYRAMKDWAEDVARRDRHPEDATTRFFDSLRQGAAIAYLGANVMTAASQISGLTQAIPMVGAKWVALGMKSVYTPNPVQFVKNVEEILASSQLMRNRFDSFNREASESLNKLRINNQIKDASTRFSYYMMSRMQMVVDTAIWKGAYLKSIDGGKSEADAIAIADQMVIDTQGSGSVQDRARVQRGGFIKKTFTLFYTYYNNKFNVATEVTARAKSIEDVPRLLADYFLLFFLESAIFSVIKGYMPADDESWAEWAMWLTLNDSLGVLYGFNQAAGAINGYYDYGGTAGLSFFGQVARAARQIKQGEMDEGMLKASTDVLSMITKMPLRSFFNAGNGAYKVAEGEIDDPLVALGRREQE